MLSYELSHVRTFPFCLDYEISWSIFSLTAPKVKLATKKTKKIIRLRCHIRSYKLKAFDYFDKFKSDA